MNIGVISSDVIPTPPTEYGGIEREAWWLSLALSELGHHVTLFAKEGSRCPPNGELLTVEGSEPEFIPLFRDKRAGLDGVVDMSHNKCIAREFGSSQPPIANLYQVMTISYPHNVVCISKGQRRHLARALPSGLDTPVIYYGINADEYPLYEGPRSGLLYMGSVLAEKQVHICIDVAEAMGIPLKICGPCWQPDYFDNAIRPRLNERIQYLGDVGGIEKLDLIQRARCLVHFPGGLGWVEAGAIIVLEALHCGTPVVCSDNGCLPEYIQQGINGFICHPFAELVEAVEACDSLDPKRCRHSVRHFRKERMAAEYVALLREMQGPTGKRW